MRTSISPDWSAVKRVSAVSSTYSTASGSSKMTAAIARQKSTSKPVYSPPSFSEKPARTPLMPQFRTPRSVTC
jgi:hypothetical protein